MIINKQLEQRIVQYLRKYGFVGKMHPWNTKAKGPDMIGLLVPLDNCLDQIALTFSELRKPITVERFQGEPLTYFECSLSRHDLLKLLERNNILVFKSVEHFYETKQEYERTLANMNRIAYLKEDYESLRPVE